jgi:hypothetical protein
MELFFFLVAFRNLAERTPPSINEGATILIKIPPVTEGVPVDGAQVNIQLPPLSNKNGGMHGIPP